MNWLDIVILIILAAFAYHGWLRGFVLTMLDVLGLLIGAAMAVILYRFPGGWLMAWGLPRPIANSLAFIGIFLIIEAIFWAVARRFYRSLPRSTEISPINHVLGIIPGLIKGVIFLAVLIPLMMAFGIGISNSTIEGSFFGRMLSRAESSTEKVVAYIVPQNMGKDFEFVTIKPGSQESIQIAAVTDPSLNPAAEQEMLTLLNQNRTQNGPQIAGCRPRALAGYVSERLFLALHSHRPGPVPAHVQSQNQIYAGR